MNDNLINFDIQTSISSFVDHIKLADSQINSLKKRHNDILNNYKNDYEMRLNMTLKDEETLHNESSKISDDLKNNQRKEIEKAIQNSFINKIYSSLSKQLNFFNVNVKNYDNLNVDDLIKKYQTDYNRYKNIDLEIENLKLSKKKMKVTYDTNIDNENNRFNNELKKIFSYDKQIYNELKQYCLLDYTYDSETPLLTDKIPLNIFVGNIIIPTNDTLKAIETNAYLRLPLAIDNMNNGNVIISINNDDLYDRDLENYFIGLTMKYIESFPAGSIRVGVYSSSLGACQNLNALFSAALNGNKFFEEVKEKKNIAINSQAAMNQSSLSSLLDQIINRAMEINNLILQKGYDNIFELIESGINVPFQLVVLHNCLQDIQDENLRKIQDCIKGYQNCGVRFIIIDDFDHKNFTYKSSSFNQIVNQLINSCEKFTYKNGKITNKSKQELEFIHVSDTVSQKYVYNFIANYCRYLGKKHEKVLSYHDIGFGKIVKDDNLDTITIPVGKTDNNVWNISFSCKGDGNTPIANLIIGAPGTGKSTLIDAMIFNGCIKYSPNELIFELLDFKDGISSSTYTRKECQIPHIKVVSEKNKPEDAEIILQNILSESERRNEQFKHLSEKTHQQIRNIAEYNLHISDKDQKMPRLIVVIDECQYLFDNEELSKYCEDIIRKCRAQGIHFILATQALTYRMDRIIQFIDGRYCFAIAKDDAEKLLDRKYVSLINSDIPKGSYKAFASNNSGKDCSKVKIAYDEGKMAEYAHEIRNKWNKYPLNMVIVGNKSPIDLSINDFNKIIDNYHVDKSLITPLGNDYNDNSLINLSFSQDNNSNVVIVGGNENYASNICLSILLASKKQNAKVYISDGAINPILKNYCSNETEIITEENGYLTVLNKVNELFEMRNKDFRKRYDPVIFIINRIENINDFLNDQKYEIKDDNLDLSSQTDDIASFYKSLKAKSEHITKVINGKTTLINLMNKCFRCNIHIVLTSQTMNLLNSYGDQVFNYQQNRQIANARIKILFNQINVDHTSSFMEDTFKSRNISNLNELAFISDNASYHKFRIFILGGK